MLWNVCSLELWDFMWVCFVLVQEMTGFILFSLPVCARRVFVGCIWAVCLLYRYVPGPCWMCMFNCGNAHEFRTNGVFSAKKKNRVVTDGDSVHLGWRYQMYICSESLRSIFGWRCYWGFVCVVEVGIQVSSPGAGEFCAHIHSVLELPGASYGSCCSSFWVSCSVASGH